MRSAPPRSWPLRGLGVVLGLMGLLANPASLPAAQPHSTPTVVLTPGTTSPAIVSQPRLVSGTSKPKGRDLSEVKAERAGRATANWLRHAWRSTVAFLKGLFKGFNDKHR